MGIPNPQLLSLSKGATLPYSEEPLSLKIPKHQGTEKFLKGPIPLNWISSAIQLSGSAWPVATAIWYLVGLTNSPTIKLTKATLDLFGISRYSKYRALEALETAGLIRVISNMGKNPLITVLNVPSDYYSSLLKDKPQTTEKQDPTII
jgi:hypothetical protein